MTRSIGIIILVVSGLALMTAGFLSPAHLRAVDARVIVRAGQGTASLVDEGLKLAEAGQTGPARLFLAAAERLGLAGKERLELALRNSAPLKSQPWGGPAPELDQIFMNDSRARQLEGRPVMELLLPRESRQTLLAFLSASPQSSVREILRTRTLTNLVHFSPAATSSGQPYDVATLLTALLFQGNHLARPLRDGFESLAFSALRRAEAQPLELAYLDLLSLAKRMNWAQLTLFLKGIESIETLRDTANLFRKNEAELPLIYAAVLLSGRPEEAARYVIDFGATGLSDLKSSLRSGQGAVRRLVQDQRRTFDPGWQGELAGRAPFHLLSGPLVELAVKSRWRALCIKYGLFLAGAFCLAWAGASLWDRPEGLGAGRFFTASELSMAAALLALALLASEPFLLEQRQKFEFPLHWKFPMVEGPVRAKIEKTMKPMVDKFSLAALVLFLVIQVVIYIFCRRRLAEIRRQPMPGKLKLKVLDNEENLFDAGLYCGFVGTVISLVCISLGIIKPSLMAAYSSTSFGIIFVSVLKIFYLRPYRRQLIVEVESQPA